jgi:hypothetical protein
LETVLSCAHLANILVKKIEDYRGNTLEVETKIMHFLLMRKLPLSEVLRCTVEDKGHVPETVPRLWRGQPTIEEVGEGVSRVRLSRGLFALIDTEDAARVGLYKWSVSGNYARSGKLRIFLHRFILQTPDGMVTDHINWDTFDNRKSNLRVCSNRENQQNRDLRKLGCVHKIKDGRKRPWVARWHSKRIGQFSTEAEAWAAIEEKRAVELASHPAPAWSERRAA